MMRNAASTRSAIVLSEGPTGSGAAIMIARSLIASQASGENRSRMTEAAERAEPVRLGSDPSGPLRVSTDRAVNAAGASSVPAGTAFHAPSSEPMLAVTSAAASSASALRLIMARTSRSVASARST
jgi:hypothetical protein